MTEQDNLFYTYTGSWDSNTLAYSLNYPYSLIFHPQTKRILQNGVIYGNGSNSVPYFIKGNNNSSDTTGRWTGSHDGIDAYKEGLTIIFLPNVTGNTTQTTININNLGERNCYFNNSEPLTQQFSVGTPVTFTYIGDASTGVWKRADMDTRQTPIQLASENNYYYLTFSTITNGLGDIYTIGSTVRYDYSTESLYCPNFIGRFVGDLIGNANTANQLYNSVNLWGQPFNGTSDITGQIEDTGSIIRLHDNNTYNIGQPGYKYHLVYGDYFKGCADGVHSKAFGNGHAYAKIYLLGHQESKITASNRNYTDSGDGYVDVNPNVYIDYNSSSVETILHSPKMRCGSSTASNGLYSFVSHDAAKFNNKVDCQSNVFVVGSVGIGISSNPSQKLHVVGNGYFTGTGKGIVYANQFIKDGGTSKQVLIANGSVKEWDDSVSVSTIVARNNSGNIYTARYYSDITDEDLSTIGSVYVTNGSSDTAIRKVTINKFMEHTGVTKIIEINKTLKVTSSWMDTGITTASSYFPDGNGTYIIQVDATAINNSTDLYPSIYSGIISIWNGTNNNTETEEVILHRSGYSTVKRLYIRTVPTLSTSGYCKIQIASSENFNSTYQIKFKFKKMI